MLLWMGSDENQSAMFIKWEGRGLISTVVELGDLIWTVSDESVYKLEGDLHPIYKGKNSLLCSQHSYGNS